MVFWVALGIKVKILFDGFSPLKRLERKARPASLPAGWLAGNAHHIFNIAPAGKIHFIY